MKSKIRKSSEKQKISAMMLKVAEGYIDMGETTEERGNYLRSACSAWNIACLPHLKREPAIKQYVEQYQKINKADEADCKALEEDLRLLIKQKDKLYPYVNVQIVDSRIENINGQEHVTVVSARIN
jgi:CRISPR/Cas system-associated endonuclease/helicase Cas3